MPINPKPSLLLRLFVIYPIILLTDSHLFILIRFKIHCINHINYGRHLIIELIHGEKGITFLGIIQVIMAIGAIPKNVLLQEFKFSLGLSTNNNSYPILIILKTRKSLLPGNN